MFYVALTEKEKKLIEHETLEAFLTTEERKEAEEDRKNTGITEADAKASADEGEPEFFAEQDAANLTSKVNEDDEKVAADEGARKAAEQECAPAIRKNTAKYPP